MDRSVHFPPPWDGVIEQKACASFDLEHFIGRTELNDTENTQVRQQRRTQVPLDWAAGTYQRHTEASGLAINIFLPDPDLGVRRHTAVDGWSCNTAIAKHFRPPKQSKLCTVFRYMDPY